MEFDVTSVKSMMKNACVPATCKDQYLVVIW